MDRLLKCLTSWIELRINYKIFFVLLLFNCATFRISFDDDHIDHWYDNRELLGGYKATLYITRFDYLTSKQLQKLEELKARGCEIGCHGFRHLNAVEYLKTHTIDEYVAVEIIPAIEVMEAHGFEPKSFAYPFGTRTPELTERLKDYFDYIRSEDDMPIDLYPLEVCLKADQLHGHLVTDKVRKILEGR